MAENEAARGRPATRTRGVRNPPAHLAMARRERTGARRPNTRILVLTIGGIVAVCLLAALFGPALRALCANPETLRAAIGGTGAAAPAIMVTAVFVQVVIAVFLIPGTPKDLLTYVAALTRCPIARIVAITTVGRIPSVATSTFTADLAAAGSWHLVALALVGTALLVAAGAVAYRALRRSQTG